MSFNWLGYLNSIHPIHMQVDDVIEIPIHKCLQPYNNKYLIQDTLKDAFNAVAHMVAVSNKKWDEKLNQPIEENFGWGENMCELIMSYLAVPEFIQKGAIVSIPYYYLGMQNSYSYEYESDNRKSLWYGTIKRVKWLDSDIDLKAYDPEDNNGLIAEVAINWNRCAQTTIEDMNPETYPLGLKISYRNWNKINLGTLYDAERDYYTIDIPNKPMGDATEVGVNIGMNSEDVEWFYIHVPLITEPEQKPQKPKRKIADILSLPHPSEVQQYNSNKQICV